MDKFHKELLSLIQAASSSATQHTFLDSYLGNTNPRYPINAPRLRAIAKEWMRNHRDLSAMDVARLIGSLVKGKSSTEKVMAGIVLDNKTIDQRKFDPLLFDKWLDHLTGWAEVDAVCTGRYCDTDIPANIPIWKKILVRLSRSSNINKRRASLVFLCSPISHNDDPRLAEVALIVIDKLKNEKEIIITRAISWLLRSMVRFHRKKITAYLNKASGLPAIAVRETKVKLSTGRKSGLKKPAEK